MFRITTEGNFLIIVIDTDLKEHIRHPLGDSVYTILETETETNPTIRFEGVAKPLLLQQEYGSEFRLANLRDASGTIFTDLDALKNLLSPILFSEGGGNGNGVSDVVEITQNNYIDKFQNIDSTKQYYIVEEVIVLQSIVLDKDITIRSYGTSRPRLKAGANIPIFISGGTASNSVYLYNIAIDNSFIGSSVFNLTGNTGFETMQLIDVNFLNSQQIGELNGFRQLFYNTVAYIGGEPSLTLSGAFGGAKITNFNGVNIADTMTNALFKKGTNLTFSSTFNIEGKIDLGSTAPLFDFSELSITNKENLIPNNLTVTRNGVINASDSTIYPTINQSNIKSLWSNNVGLPNTTKYIKIKITTEITTIITTINTYYPLNGAFVIGQNSHFDMPLNGQIRLLSGNGTYHISGNLIIDGTQNNEIDIRITKSEDGGNTFPIVVDHVTYTINSLVGGRDVAFVPISSIVTLVENNRLRYEIGNKSSTNNLTAELDSSFIVNKIT
jgi:hypothetical protein